MAAKMVAFLSVPPPPVSSTLVPPRLIPPPLALPTPGPSRGPGRSDGPGRRSPRPARARPWSARPAPVRSGSRCRAARSPAARRCPPAPRHRPVRYRHRRPRTPGSPRRPARGGSAPGHPRLRWSARTTVSSRGHPPLAAAPQEPPRITEQRPVDHERDHGHASFCAARPSYQGLGLPFGPSAVPGRQREDDLHRQPAGRPGHRAARRRARSRSRWPARAPARRRCPAPPARAESLVRPGTGPKTLACARRGGCTEARGRRRFGDGPGEGSERKRVSFDCARVRHRDEAVIDGTATVIASPVRSAVHEPSGLGLAAPARRGPPYRETKGSTT